MLHPRKGMAVRALARPHGEALSGREFEICQRGQGDVAKAPAGYSGQGFSPRGDKGRYVLPPAFRNAIAPGPTDERTLCLAKHDRWNCLTGFGLARTESFEAQLDREEDNAVRLRQGIRPRAALDPAVVVHRSAVRCQRALHPARSSRRAVRDRRGHLLPRRRRSSSRCGRPKQLYAMGEAWAGQQALCRKLEADAKGKRK